MSPETPDIETEPSLLRRILSAIRWFALVLMLGITLLQCVGLAVSPKASPSKQSLGAMVEQANDAANGENFQKAIQLYEQIVKQAPQETSLKRNLAVLYFNYGVQLQKQKDYPSANSYFDKAMALDASSKEPKKAKAASYFYEAIDLREAGSADYPAMQALIQKALDLEPGELAFKKGMASSLLGEARGLAEQGSFETAVPKLEKAMALDPQGPAIRQSLVNIYLQLAKTQPDHRKAWSDKALALDNSPSIQEKLQGIENAQSPLSTSTPTSQGSGASTGSSKKRFPKEAMNLSANDMLGDIEKSLNLPTDAKRPLKERLEAAEKETNGTVGQGPINVRIKELYATLFGQEQITPPDAQPLLQANIETAPENYLEDIFKITEGRVIRWGKFPLRVYIEEPKDTPHFKPEYVEAVKAALETWKTQTNGFTTYVIVKNRLAADVQFDWTEAYTDRFAEMATVPDYYKKYAVPKVSPMMRALSIASMVTPGYFGLAPQAIGAAMQYKQLKKLQTIIDESKITLGLAPTEGLTPEAAKQLIQNMAAHEFGHALGLKGHSTKEGDLMFPALKADIPERPSTRDVETLRQLYSRPASLVLNVR